MFWTILLPMVQMVAVNKLGRGLKSANKQYRRAASEATLNSQPASSSTFYSKKEQTLVPLKPENVKQKNQVKKRLWKGVDTFQPKPLNIMTDVVTGESVFGSLSSRSSTLRTSAFVPPSSLPSLWQCWQGRNKLRSP
jgi:hypothetical protein